MKNIHLLFSKYQKQANVEIHVGDTVRVKRKFVCSNPFPSCIKNRACLFYNREGIFRGHSTIEPKSYFVKFAYEKDNPTGCYRFSMLDLVKINGHSSLI